MLNFNVNAVSKKFNKDWIFKDVSFSLSEESVLGITGSNGSGKSTLLQILSGYRLPTSGIVSLDVNNSKIAVEDLYKHVSMSSPFLELIEEFTLIEQLQFYFRFKEVKNGLSTDELLSLSLLTQHAHKQICDFSSGMRQRVKLLLAFTSNSNLLLLDEPCSNLDNAGVDWYKKMAMCFSTGRIVVISSNHHSDELFSCNKFISMEDFFPST